MTGLRGCDIFPSGNPRFALPRIPCTSGTPVHNSFCTAKAFKGIPWSEYERVSPRRRMETEAKAKVVASVWGAKFLQFLAALAVLPRSFERKG